MLNDGFDKIHEKHLYIFGAIKSMKNNKPSFYYFYHFIL